MQTDSFGLLIPVSGGDSVEKYNEVGGWQRDGIFSYVDGAYDRPGPEMVVYKLRDCA